MTPFCYGQVERESTPWRPADHYRFCPGGCILRCLAPDASLWEVGLPPNAITGADGGLHRYRGARKLRWRLFRGRHIGGHRSDLGTQEARKSSRVQGSR